MTPESLRILIAAGETTAVEFKGEKSRPLSDNELVETVVCLANRTASDLAKIVQTAPASEVAMRLAND